MAERRMFTKKVTDDDNFMSLSSSAQALYLHLSMSADDDGFCNQVSLSMFKAHASVQDLQALLEKRYIYQFDNGVIVIKHWRMANALRKDRYTPTAFQEELAKLDLKENGSYTWLPSGCHEVAKCLPQDRLGKDSIDKDSIGEREEKPKKGFTPPTLDEVRAYCEERNNGIDAERFVDFYSSKGWMVGKNKMRDWKACVRTWEKRENPKPQQQTKNYDSIFSTEHQAERPYHGFPPEWFNGDQIDESKVHSVIRPVVIENGWYKPEEISAKELIEIWRLRRQYCDDNGI